MTQRTYC